MAAGVTTNRVLLLFAALLFSTGGAAIKLASLTSWQIAGYRSGIAAVFLWIVLPRARGNWTWRTLVAGAVYAAMVILFVVSNRMTTAANAILLQSTYPLYLLILGPLFLKERLRAVDFVVVLGVATGAALLFSGSEHVVATAPSPARGNVVALISGLAWALTLVALRWIGKRDPDAESAAAVVIAGNALAFLFCLPLATSGSIRHTQDAIVLLYLGVVQVGLGYVCLTRSIRRVPAIDAAMLLLAEPVLSPLWAWLVHGEQPTATALSGGAIILVTATGGAWSKTRSS